MARPARARARRGAAERVTEGLSLRLGRRARESILSRPATGRSGGVGEIKPRGGEALKRRRLLECVCLGRSGEKICGPTSQSLLFHSSKIERSTAFGDSEGTDGVGWVLRGRD